MSDQERVALVRKGTSAATLLANRANSLKSTGPTTDLGKAMVRANAGKHWGRSEGIRKLMPALGESRLCMPRSASPAVPSTSKRID